MPKQKQLSHRVSLRGFKFPSGWTISDVRRALLNGKTVEDDDGWVDATIAGEAVKIRRIEGEIARETKETSRSGP